jgi:hypothetical protein
MNIYDGLISNAPADGQRLSKEEYAARKRADRDAVFGLSDTTAMEVAADGNRFHGYLDVQSRFDRYSAVNALLILAQKPGAVHIGSFDYWKSKGCFVKAGQTGISILEPQEYTKGDGSPGIGYNAKKVFDVTQVNTRNLKQEPPQPAFSDRQLIAALVHNAPMEIASVDTLPGGLRATSDIGTGKISVRKGMAFGDIFRSVALELAAANLREGTGVMASAGFAAYCASYILCKKYGVDAKQFSFVEAPAAFEGMGAQDVKAGLAQIRDAACDISRRMARQLEPIGKSSRYQEAR